MKKRFFYIISFLLSVCLFSCLVSSVWAETKMDTPSAGIIPKLPKTPNDPELFNGHVYPNWGPVCQRYTYSVVYQDKENRPPEYMKIYFNGQMIDMEKAYPKNSDYKKGVKYIYRYAPDKLGGNFYYFEASNGLGKTRDSIIDSPDNGPVLFESAFDQNEIAVIDRESGQKILEFSSGKEWVGGIALSDDGQYLAVKTSYHIYLFDTQKPNEPLWSYEYGQGFMVGGDVKGGVDISGDGSRIAASIGSSVVLFDKNSNQPLWQYGQAGNAYNIAISQDGKYLAAAIAQQEGSENSNSLILWSAEKSEPLWRYQASGNFHDVSLSNDGRFIAGSTGCPDRRAYIFSKDSNVPLVRSEMLTRDSPVHRAKISSDGQLAAFGSESDGGAVFLFSRDSQEPLWKFPAPGGSSIRALNFTPDGEYIGAADFGGDAFFLQKDSSNPVASWQLSNALGAADISDDGSFLAVGGTDNKLYLLNRENKRKTEISFNEYIGEIDISSNGKYIAAGTGGSVYFFETFGSEDKIFPCTTITEPEPEGEMMGEDFEKNNFLEQDLGDTPQENSLITLVLGFGFLISIFILGGYLLKIKFSLLKVNKKVVILLSGLAGLFLVLIIIFVLMMNGESGQDRNQPQDEREKGICGNSLCEGEIGETQKSCPQDCSMGD